MTVPSAVGATASCTFSHTVRKFSSTSLRQTALPTTRRSIYSLTLQTRSCLTAFTLHFSFNALGNYILTIQQLVLRTNKVYHNMLKNLLKTYISVYKTKCVSVILVGQFQYHYPPYRFNIDTRLYGYINAAHPSLVGQPKLLESFLLLVITGQYNFSSYSDFNARSLISSA